jgi:hypothetical protein
MKKETPKLCIWRGIEVLFQTVEGRDLFESRMRGNGTMRCNKAQECEASEIPCKWVSSVNGFDGTDKDNLPPTIAETPIQPGMLF